MKLISIYKTCIAFLLTIVCGYPTIQSAQAGFVLVFDDPNTPEEEFRIVDEGQNDTGAGVGNLQYNGNFGGEEFVVGVTALSKDWEGTRFPLGPGFPEDAEFSININLFTSKSGRSMTVRLTDTGYNSSYDQADCYINTALGTPFGADGAESIQFRFFGDTADAEFGESFLIGSSEVIDSPDDQNLIVVSGPAEAVGSLTMETTFIGNGTAEARFTQILAIAPGGSTEPQPPTITTQPDSVSAEVGETVSFTVEATGTSPLGYEWMHNGIFLAGETNPVLTLENVQTDQAGSYQVIVSNPGGIDSSTPALLSVFESGEGQPPTFTVQPESQLALPGDTVSFTVAAEGTPQLSYQWQFNGVDLPGETSSVLEIESVQSGHGGVYQAFVANDFGSAESERVALFISEGPPTITEDPENQIVDQGGTAVFTVAATGAPPLAYQWYRFDTELTAIAGATSPTLTLTDVQPDLETSNFLAVVANQHGGAMSDSASVDVIVPESEPPTITSEPQDQTVTEGDTAVFTVTATGTEPLVYQWYQMTPIYVVLEGETSATLTLTDVQLDEAGEYSVTVQNDVDAAFSRYAVLTVETAPEQPTLSITSSAPDEVTISWSPATEGFVLQEKTDLSTSDWTDSASGSTNPAILSADGSEKYFQVAKP